MRRLYNLPPTDPRYLALTDEQILLEIENHVLDHPEEAGFEHFSDPQYEEWERKAIEEDRKLSYEDSGGGKSVDEIRFSAKRNKALDSHDNDEWEEVPID